MTAAEHVALFTSDVDARAACVDVEARAERPHARRVVCQILFKSRRPRIAAAVWTTPVAGLLGVLAHSRASRKGTIDGFEPSRRTAAPRQAAAQSYWADGCSPGGVAHLQLVEQTGGAGALRRRVSGDRGLK